VNLEMSGFAMLAQETHSAKLDWAGLGKARLGWWSLVRLETAKVAAMGQRTLQRVAVFRSNRVAFTTRCMTPTKVRCSPAFVHPSGRLARRSPPSKQRNLFETPGSPGVGELFCVAGRTTASTESSKSSRAFQKGDCRFSSGWRFGSTQAGAGNGLCQYNCQYNSGAQLVPTALCLQGGGSVWSTGVEQHHSAGAAARRPRVCGQREFHRGGT
jgi:hypothetical protein